MRREQAMAFSSQEYDYVAWSRSVNVVEIHGNEVATFTRGARTVPTRGPLRTFAEATAEHAVTHATWVRALPQPFETNIDAEWLDAALMANSAAAPDVLALAMQYTRGSPPIHEGGIQIAGEAEYGPLTNGKREEGSDFNDYLGVTWTYPDGPNDPPEGRQLKCLDCSGL
jgi:hypothetical protein